MKSYLFLAALSILAGCGQVNTSEIEAKSTASGQTLIPPYNVAGKTISVYQTAQNTAMRLAKGQAGEFQALPQPLETQICVFVDPDKSFQEFLGIGAAITDASAETFAKLPEDKQQELLKAYFNKDSGIGYTIIRTNINSCDFSSGSYTYIEEGDRELKTFDIAPDKRFKIPMIKAATEAAGGKVTFYVSPWSPPAFMKTNNSMLKGGSLKPEFNDAWAKYYALFIKAYEAEGMPVWGLTIQNEPMATQTWESCIYSAEEERDFLKFHLGPTLEKEGLGDKKIIMWDHNRDLIYQRAQTYFRDPIVNKYAWGIGFHWYESWSGGDPMFDNIALVREAFPDKKILFTEGCQEKFDAKYDRWDLGERYGRSMINDFNNGAVGWTDWNILLDETGGPNHVGNFCYAPVHGIAESGAVVYTNAYYYIGHFSKFIKPGAKRIIASPSRSQLLSTAFKNPDGSVVVVVMNQSDADTPYWVWINGQALETRAAAHSINTVVIQ